MKDPIDAAAARTAHRALLQAQDALNLMSRSENRELSLVRIVQSLKSGRGVDGFDGEFLQERARLAGADFDPHYPNVPYTALAVRTPLAANQGSANGGFLVGTTVEEQVLDILRPYSPLLQSGVTVRTGLTANNVVPTVNGDVAGYWLSQETGTITESEPVLGSIAITPKNAGCFARWSRQLELQAPTLEVFLRQLFARQITQLIDTAAISGPDNVGQPLGLLNTAGIGSQSGSAFAWSTAWSVRTGLANANVTDANVSWLGHPGTRTVLATRESGAGDGFIWSADDTLTGRSARVSTILPTGTMIAGEWSQLVYAFFGDGFVIDSTPYNSASDFATGISAMRLIVAVDTYLQHPAAFVAVTSVT